jgi:hypothetical protein
MKRIERRRAYKRYQFANVKVDLTFQVSPYEKEYEDD